jgi:elongation factor Ts
MMDCKSKLKLKDFELAIENLRKRTKVAANRSDRESTEGAAIAVNADKTAG